MSAKRNEYSEDLFADTRMSFGEHIEDLRSHLLRAIYGFVIALIASFFIAPYVLDVIKRPVKRQMEEFSREKTAKIINEWEKDNADALRLAESRPVQLTIPRGEFVRQALPPEIAEKALAAGPEEVTVHATLKDSQSAREQLRPLLERLGSGQDLIVISVMEGFMAWVKVSLICALVLGSPWIFYQLWSFVAAGLYPHEKRYVNVYLPFSLGLFIGGVLMAQFLVMPRAVWALLWFDKWLGLEPMLRLNDWLSFAIMLPLLTGLAFQLPLVMLFLERIGVFTVEVYVKNWKIALFVIHLIAAIGPAVDPLTMEMIALPMFGLYWLGILMCRFKARAAEDEELGVPSSEEMVEV